MKDIYPNKDLERILREDPSVIAFFLGKNMKVHSCNIDEFGYNIAFESEDKKFNLRKCVKDAHWGPDAKWGEMSLVWKGAPMWLFNVQEEHNTWYGLKSEYKHYLATKQITTVYHTVNILAS